ncbi:MAG: D-glycero-beta-D-manno-heptose 1,7-bisphosphate 7-phosphatase [Flavobacteriaceae bacterium]|nr:D-glycero-beta-D-manno-heptose 1,7-bisphosphate 7-phosphatase [Flavobacteriaceae bacterium]
MPKLKAVFLDRDGVINVEKEYLYKINDLIFIDGAFEALRYLQKKKYLLFIITNQSGIGRRYYTIQDFENLTKEMFKILNREGVNINTLEFCPHKPEDNCNCRKPKTGMIEKILMDYDIDLGKSWLIGDKDIDIETATNIGINNTVQVLSGHTFDENKSKAKYIIKSIESIKEVIT